MLTGKVARAGWSFKRIVWLIGSVFLLGAIGIWVSWRQDEVALRQRSEMIIKDLHTDAARIRAINDWVYRNKGFAKNDQYFIIPTFGPTPIHVMEQGGDCSDKSRLVMAMLTSIGINAGLVMISPCLNCDFIHTVVEAEYENGRMVVDPTWDVDYPAGDGRFFGVRDLAGTDRGRERIIELQRQRPITDTIAGMPQTEATFDYAVAMNWDRDIVTRSVGAMLKWSGCNVETLFQPRFLEDPKILLVSLLIAMAAACVFGGL